MSECDIAVAEDTISTLQALEALVFVEAAATAAPPTMSAGELKVYFRRKRRPRDPPPTTVPQQPHATAAPPPPSPHTLQDNIGTGSSGSSSLAQGGIHHRAHQVS